MFFKNKKIFNEEKQNILNKKIDKLAETIQKSNLEDLSYIIGNKKQVILRNFLAGISRGVGIGIGITIVTAILVSILRQLVTLNIPVIGKYISDIVEIVEKSR